MSQTVQEMLANMRSRLSPQGSAPLVKLQLGNAGYVQLETVTAAIDHLEKLMKLRGALGQASPLEKLGILLLTESD